ncbi:MAG: DUF3806 domain-containing protein [Deltaproteobacteria bacterium]|nr:DUF3806 domain-containing protein [Deltaproteobacteria bacterium]
MRPDHLRLQRPFGTSGCADSRLRFEPKPSDGSLLGLHEAVGNALTAAGYLVYDPKPLWVEASTFHAVAMHLVAAAQEGPLPYRHLVVESAAPWEAQTEQDFLRDFFWLPLHDSSLEAPPCFSFAGATPPASVRYLLGNGWWGELEAALIGDLAAGAPGGPTADEIRSSLHTRLRELSLDPASAAETYDAILMGLPRATGATYQPAATLTALGVLLGDALNARVSSLDWRTADPSEGRVLVLDDTKCHGFLRPVDFTVEAYAVAPKPVAARYLSWAEERVSACRQQPNHRAPSPPPPREGPRARKAGP